MKIKSNEYKNFNWNKASQLVALAMFLPMTVWAVPSVPPSVGAIVQPQPDSNLAVNETQQPTIHTGQLIEKPIDQGDTDLRQGEINIQQIKFQHNLQLISDAELQQFVQPYLNKTYRLSKFKTIVGALQQWLMTKHGLIKAQVWIPLQEIEHGVVQLNITQGTVAGYAISETVTNKNQLKVLQQFAKEDLALGSPLTQQSLEEIAYRATDYLNQPVQIVLIPTPTVGDYKVLLEVRPQPKVSGSVTLDNTGSVYTSVFRDFTTVKINDLTAHSDQLTFGAQLLNAYQHTLYSRYELPLSQGWRLGVDTQYYEYELCCDFKPLQAKGEVKQLGIDALYAITRQRDFSLWLGVKAKYWNGINEQLDIKTSDREIKNGSLLSNVAWSNRADHSLKLELVGGRVNLNNAVDLANDKVSAKIEGGYVKMLANYFINYPLSARGTVLSHITTQLSNRNLESSEKLSMGGLMAIRAYPYGESLGDLGAVAQFEYRYQMSSKIEASAFYDAGYVQLNKNKWINDSANQYGLQGVGVSSLWKPTSTLSLQAVVAVKLGKNKGRDVNQNDSDGRDSAVRAWVVGSWSF
jgi:hemolysin activation/secretion protein